MKTFLIALAYVDRACNRAQAGSFVMSAPNADEMNALLRDRLADTTWLAQRLDVDPDEIQERCHAIFDSGVDDYVIVEIGPTERGRDGEQGSRAER